jgi:prolyl oligopeptidase
LEASAASAEKRTDRETFYVFTSFTVPETVYHLDIASNASAIFKQPKVDFDPAAFETTQVFFQSKDGTRIPMFIAHKRGMKLDGHNPTMLYGYGGFNISMTPDFQLPELAWMEMGGVYAMPNLRGGGEYGSEWHRAGRKEKKQNVFDDFIAAAEWLITNNYTSPQKLTISGGSNGGLLVGACMTQRPELFGAALPAVGVMDMLRFHKFTIGWAWTSDYGSSENADEFRTLYAYSPLHNLRPGVRYPRPSLRRLIMMIGSFPRTVSSFAARLQECQAPNGPPVLIRIETKAGHGAGTALNKVIEKRTDELAFAWQMTAGGPEKSKE